MLTYVVSSIPADCAWMCAWMWLHTLGALQFVRKGTKFAISRYFEFAINRQEAYRGDRGGLEAIAYVCPVASPSRICNSSPPPADDPPWSAPSSWISLRRIRDGCDRPSSRRGDALPHRRCTGRE